MKKTLLLLLALFVSTMMYAGNFVMIKVKNQQNLQELFSRQDINIHYYNDNFVLATSENIDENMILLDENSFASNDLYFIVYCNESEQTSYASREKNNMEILYSDANINIVKPLNANLRPAKNDGMVAISNKTARLAKATRDFPSITEEDEKVRGFMDQVSIENLTATVEYLQAYEERYYNSDKAYDAANWIQEQFDNLEVLETEQFPVSYYGNPCAPNVIAIQWGTTKSEEFVVCGSHLDSYSYSGMCPGADDNATGVASVLEAARILSQHNFERSIIYCAFGAEEIGLIGSAAYAEYCAEMGMNVVGYFNNDMNGYLNPGDEIHIDLIYPNSVEPIGEYYMNLANVYFPEMQVRHVNFQAGDSDHTSFNNNGFMGIYPFEDYQNYSPYIHTGNDMIGPSVNSFEMSQRYAQMNIACVSTLAILDTESVEENIANNNVAMFPNPAKNELTIASEFNGNNEVQIINSVGQVVKEFSFMNETTVNIDELNAGVYFVKVIGENTTTKKLVVKE